MGNRNDADQKKFSAHVEYELRMLNHSLRKLREYQSSDDCSRSDDCCAYLESFLLHVRNLVPFLYDQNGRGSGGNDVLAKHFCDDAQAWRTARRNASRGFRLSNETYRRVHEHLAHITYCREEFREWKVQEIAQELAEVLSVFQKYASSERLDEGVRIKISELISIVNPANPNQPLFSGVLSSTGGEFRSAKIREL